MAVTAKNGQTYKIDFISMTQTNVKYNTVRRIRKTKSTTSVDGDYDAIRSKAVSAQPPYTMHTDIPTTWSRHFADDISAQPASPNVCYLLSKKKSKRRGLLRNRNV